MDAAVTKTTVIELESELMQLEVAMSSINRRVDSVERRKNEVISALSACRARFLEWRSSLSSPDGCFIYDSRASLVPLLLINNLTSRMQVIISSVPLITTRRSRKCHFF